MQTEFSEPAEETAGEGGFPAVDPSFCYKCPEPSTHGLNGVYSLPDGSKETFHFYACEKHKDAFREG